MNKTLEHKKDFDPQEVSSYSKWKHDLSSLNIDMVDGRNTTKPQKTYDEIQQTQWTKPLEVNTTPTAPVISVAFEADTGRSYTSELQPREAHKPVGDRKVVPVTNPVMRHSPRAEHALLPGRPPSVALREQLQNQKLWLVMEV